MKWIEPEANRFGFFLPTSALKTGRVPNIYTGLDSKSLKIL